MSDLELSQTMSKVEIMKSASGIYGLRALGLGCEKFESIDVSRATSEILDGINFRYYLHSVLTNSFLTL